MKELGYIEIYFTTEDDKNWHRMLDNRRIRYMEPFEDILEEIKYEDLSDGILFHKTKDSIFPWGKKCLYASDWDLSIPLRIYPEDKIYKKTVWNKINYSLTYNNLSENMNSKDFIEYLKDNGLNICPIKQE